MRAQLRDHNAYLKTTVEETERAATYCDTRTLYQILKSISCMPAEVVEVFLCEMEASFQIKPKG